MTGDVFADQAHPLSSFLARMGEEAHEEGAADRETARTLFGGSPAEAEETSPESQARSLHVPGEGRTPDVRSDPASQLAADLFNPSH